MAAIRGLLLTAHTGILLLRGKVRNGEARRGVVWPGKTGARWAGV
jgi:hypothetical protein